MPALISIPSVTTGRIGFLNRAFSSRAKVLDGALKGRLPVGIDIASNEVADGIRQVFDKGSPLVSIIAQGRGNLELDRVHAVLVQTVLTVWPASTSGVSALPGCVGDTT